VCEPSQYRGRASDGRRSTSIRGFGHPDPAEEVALVARAKRDLLLRVHRFRLRWEDLEDCYGQATLELLAHTRRGGEFSSRAHLSNTLEQRFLSRIHDRRRALAGRSPMQATLDAAASLGGAGDREVEVEDARAELEKLVLLRGQLRDVARLARELSPDQRLVLACQVGLQMTRADFCSRFGWSPEKYRKVAQRARARLRSLIAAEANAVPLRAGGSEGESGTLL
jgi:DNA-directed RNA polymerase specialized sigma24 family protein